ncbi:MAG: hypothetical protein AAGG75_04115 [Bacteroidota bacterium]
MTTYSNLRTRRSYSIFSSFRPRKLKASLQLLCTITALFCSLTFVNGQIFTLAWTGIVSDEFHDPLNWSPAIAPAGQNLTIMSNGSNAPVVSGFMLAHNILVGPNADLTIEAGAILIINASSFPLVSQGILFNRGTIVNNGTINITGVANEPFAINNSGSFTNESTFPGGTIAVATINIITSTGIGIHSTGTFLNRGANINIGVASTVGGNGILVANGLFTTRAISFPNVANSTINIGAVTQNGIGVSTNGAFTITSGTVNLGSGAAVGENGVYNEGNFTALGGAINVEGAGAAGIRNEDGATFTNSSSIISIGTTSNNVDFGIRNYGTFFNSETIDIERALRDGIENRDNGQFTNDAGARITIGSAEAVGQVGLENNSTFTNRGVINIKLTNTEGILNLSANGNFNNLDGAVLNIGTMAGGSIGRIGIWNALNSTFTNNASTIKIGNTGSVTAASGLGMYVQDSDFVNENAALLSIGQNSNNTTKFGLTYENATFINRNSTITVDNAGSAGIQGTLGSTFLNEDGSVINIGQNQGNISASGLMVISSVFINDNATVNIDRVGVSGLDVQQDGDVSTTNSGEINIGMNGGANNITIYGCSLFGVLSAAGGTVNINNTGNDGILHAEGSITTDRNGQINIGTSGGASNISGVGIDGKAFISNFNGTIQVDNTSGAGFRLDASSVFMNAPNGTVNIGTNGANLNINGYGITVANVFQNDGGTINIEQTGRAGILLDGGNTPVFNNIVNGNVNIFDTDGIGLLIRNGSFNNAANLTIGNSNQEAIRGVNNNSLDNRGGTITVDGLIQNITAVAGTLAPGNSPGEMSIVNAFDISAATLEVEIDGTTPITEHDVLDVAGVATIGGATLSISLNYTPTFNDRIVFINANSVSGTFNNPTLPADWRIDYSVSGQVALVYEGISCLVSPKIFLQGPFNTSTTLLNDDLRTDDWVPVLEPYSAMSGFTHINGGGETHHRSRL